VAVVVVVLGLSAVTVLRQAVSLRAVTVVSVSLPLSQVLQSFALAVVPVLGARKVLAVTAVAVHLTTLAQLTRVAVERRMVTAVLVWLFSGCQCRHHSRLFRLE
jgi:hypothetical protein